MKITQLDIRDFGVFQGEALEDIGEGIIVIGGANRSGKTSLMQIIRNIPYGFSQNSNLPPPKFQYDVRCDLQSEEGNEVNILLKGFSNPEIVYKNAIEAKDNKRLYNIDKSTYRELFTISLDELNKSSDKEDSNLQSMLLGAGFKHIIKIPGVAKELREKANVIGGTRGNPSTKMFKPFVENIKKSVEGRRKSMGLLDTYVQKKNIFSKLQDTINSKEKELLNINNNIIKLEMLKHNYELNENKKNLEVELRNYFFNPEDIREYNIEKAKALKTQFTKELEQYNNDKDEFQSQTSKDKNIKELLLEKKVEITCFYNGLSGIKEMIKNLLIIKKEYYEKTQALKNKIKKANDNWSSLNTVEQINCDEVQQDVLTDNIEKYRKIEAEIVVCNKKIEECKIEREILEKQIKPFDNLVYTKKYFYFTLITIILGLVLFFIDKLLGSSIILIGGIGAALYLFMNYSNSKLLLNRNLETKASINNLEIVFSKATGELKNLDLNSIEMNNIMDEYRDILKLDARVTVEGIKDYFKIAAFLKDEIFEYNLLKKKLDNEFNATSEYLNDINKVLNKFTEYNMKNSEQISTSGLAIDNISNICNDILLKVEVLYKQLMLCEKTEKSFSKLNLVQREIEEFLARDNSDVNIPLVNNSQENQCENIILSLEKYISVGEKYIKYVNHQNELKIINEKLLQAVKSQRIRGLISYERKEFVQENYENENIKIKDENEKLLEILGELYKQYGSTSELNFDYDVLNTENSELIRQLEDLRNEKQTTKDEIQALNSDDKLLQYEQNIIEARSQLRPLAERYAVYNTAALFLEKIRERFLENTKEKLLSGASDILCEITSGEYKDIMPMEDIMQGDFKTVLRDESIVASSKELSRGTKEQLFLAVRISRIKEIQPSLPVILDDSFVNFDIAHTKNTVMALEKLAKTHQIFVLTCHATLVELIKSQCAKAQYFKLDKGKFTKSTGGDLQEYLRTL
ncbi:AAA family ATPase [Clostridium estertheticum]|uniref:AAA family ATPase n=1 Tax=Clostridium estertheticum TaxID=238834 RepID=UPI0013E95CBF|nr:AAA family ATPase [Clostridium estertheticum]MBZ9688425.1 AAA family ATPase [Clostridium estertheticum]